MRIRIDEITRKTFQGQKGSYDTYNIKSGRDWYSCYVGAWNKDWRSGDEIDVTVESVNKNGKTFNNIKAPPRSFGPPQGNHNVGDYSQAQQSQQPQASPAAPSTVAVDMLNVLKQIYRVLNVIKDEMVKEKSSSNEPTPPEPYPYESDNIPI